MRSEMWLAVRVSIAVKVTIAIHMISALVAVNIGPIDRSLEMEYGALGLGYSWHRDMALARSPECNLHSGI